MSPEKCNYTVFARRNSSKTKFGFRLFGELIPHEAKPVSLGITFDECLNFRQHVSVLRAKCTQRLNILKILASRSWQLSRETLVSIYKSLVGSVLDYSAFMIPTLPADLLKTVQAVQNNAVRIIYHRSKLEHTPTGELCAMAGLDLVQDRMNELNSRYYSKAIQNNNVLIKGLMGDYCRDRRAPSQVKKTLLCGHVGLFSSHFGGLRG